MKRLTLKTEHLTELTADELSHAHGAAVAAYTGNPVCSFSLGNPCVSNVCVPRPLYTITETTVIGQTS
ncbi:MAG TPA: hypothetical protein VGX28_11890 [Frankiaceae bacterium]|nr:hypothetical protein [Frankiaceae bacterium]